MCIRDRHFTQLSKIDFTKFAEAVGVESVTINNDNDIDKSIKWAVNSTDPVLLSVMLDPDEVFPPLRTKIEQRRRDIMGKK